MVDRPPDDGAPKPPKITLDHVGSVELHDAFMWDCPHCGRENWQRAITYRPTPQDAVKLGIDPTDAVDGVMITLPNYVMCGDPECGQRFAATSAFNDGEDEEDT